MTNPKGDMQNRLSLIGLKGIPLIKSDDNISDIILAALGNNNVSLQDGDILVIAQSIISKSSNQIINLREVHPSEQAKKIYKKHAPIAKDKGIPIKSPELIQKILDESKEILKSEHVIIVETHHGFICANAGIDKSNVEGEYNVSLLPKNSDIDAKKIRKSIYKKTKKNVAIIIADSFGRPFRVGAVGVALGISGIEPLIDKRGSTDLYGNRLQSTIIGQIDNLASAAQLIMGESDEGIPIVLIRGYKYEIKENTSIREILRDKKDDLFRGVESEILLGDLLRNRRSYKTEFDSKEVDTHLIEKCIEIARWAPNAHNAQVWRFVILEKEDLRAKLIDNMNRKLREDLTNDGKSETFIINKIKKTRKQFLDAPILLILCLDESYLEEFPDQERNENEFILGVQSISAAATYLLLAFEIEKLAACWYCAPLFSKEIVKNTLHLPKSFVPMAFFTVGYPLKKVIAPKRKGIDEFIHNLNNHK